MLQIIYLSRSQASIALREILASNHGRIAIPPGWKPIPRQSGVRSPLQCWEPSG
ncbi:hypothetical protein QUA54_30490 [Microcoleus sp. MOSTC5]|uniref:hypothetical protein n=1 Tax=Microcoleus sp. MOSTC5 TaxID=3055378 RepID=UPI002FD50EE5